MHVLNSQDKATKVLFWILFTNFSTNYCWDISQGFLAVRELRLTRAIESAGESNGGQKATKYLDFN